MITYFKYTSGESFTLNGEDYTGFFNIQNGEAFSGKKLDTTSDKLSSKGNFMSEFYLNQMEFDNQYNNIEDITPYYPNAFDILNKNELDKMFGSINKNNLVVFKSLITSNPQIIDFDENSCHFYGLSSSNIDMRNDDIMNGKTTIMHIDRFDYSDEWNFLEKIKYGDFIVRSDQKFKYLCTTGTNLITINGSFDDKSLLTYDITELDFGKEVYGIHYDEFSNNILIIINGELMIYEGLNFIECGNLILVDSVRIGDVLTNPLKWDSVVKFSEANGLYSQRFFNINPYSIKFMKYGDNIRTTLDGGILTLWNKKSSDIINTINLSLYEIGDVISISIRNVDDYIGILHLKNGRYHLSFFDPVVLDFKTSVLEDLFDDEWDIKFSSYDSNIIYLRGNTRVEIRCVSNPANAIGNFKEFSLKYPPRHTFGATNQKFGDSILKWNTSAMSSNRFTNILFSEITKGDKNYTILHNSGRLYALKQLININNYTSINKRVSKSFQNVQCGDFSFGLLFNRNITNILKDILTLYTKSTNSFKFKKDDVLLSDIKKIDYDLKNLKINGNESINTVTMQRICDLITEIQRKLIANLSTIE